MRTVLHRYLCLFCFCLINSAQAQPIDRQALVLRHKVVNNSFDALSSVSVGNGRFAFTADITGLQSFPDAYAKGVALGTESEWGWHSFPNTAGYQFSETLRTPRFNGREIPYSVQVKEPARGRDAVNYFRQNPHRLQLGNIGMEIRRKDGGIAAITDIKDIHQELDPWTGEIHSRFTVEGIPVEVFTYCHQQQDLIAVKIISPLLAGKRLSLRIRFPYPTDAFKDAGNNYADPERHSSVLQPIPGGALIKRGLNDTHYSVSLHWKGAATIQGTAAHSFSIDPSASTEFEMTALFSPSIPKAAAVSFMQTAASSKKEWRAFWTSGGAVDLSGSTDSRAIELERRIVLSQYLTKIQCSGNYPPQETGLTYNSWYGKPHLEMHWWHGIHFALWGRIALLEKSLDWYRKVYTEAQKIAVRQGYNGVRWQKMTDNKGKETPSSVGAFLIWQQPHVIYFSELAYREHKDVRTLDRYKDLVFATADFMASFAHFDPATKRYVLGEGVIPAQEKFKPEETIDPTYELVYWYWALQVARQWRQRLHLPPNQKWDAVVQQLAHPAIRDGKYLFTESATDSYTNPEFRTDHPAVLGALGMLPATPLIDDATMQHTFSWIVNNWNWPSTWGWDYPMAAMTATRLGMPAQAIDALLMPVQKNTYLPNGHNYQDERLTIYLPGNGGLLAAIALMCAGYEGSNTAHPGIPSNGKWVVRYEGLRKML